MSMLEVEALLEELRDLEGGWSGPIPLLEVESDALEVIRLLNREVYFYVEIGVLIEVIIILFFFYWKLYLY